MHEKSVDELKTELAIVKALKTERTESNTLYSPMIVKTFMYWSLGIIGAVMLTALAKLAFDALLKMVTK